MKVVLISFISGRELTAVPGAERDEKMRLLSTVKPLATNIISHKLH